MNIGIILPCYNIEEQINLLEVLTFLNTNSQLYFCFVNNGSSDKSLEMLEHLKKKSLVAISVLDIKRKKNMTNAIKAGVRFLNAKEDFDELFSVVLDFRLNLETLNKIVAKKVLTISK